MEKFLKNQEDLIKTKKYKAKVEEIVKDFLAAINSVPVISLNSQKIINDMRKKIKLKIYILDFLMNLMLCKKKKTKDI